MTAFRAMFLLAVMPLCLMSPPWVAYAEPSTVPEAQGLTTPAATTKSNAMPDDAVIQQAIHNYREAHYEQTLLLLSTLP
ncbi:MAG: hypothetical protein VKK59_02365, partial [Vampirovibrionales bacterium]|nr:hypothetical protein [Vampirovibrionales bacterium]